MVSGSVNNKAKTGLNKDRKGPVPTFSKPSPGGSAAFGGKKKSTPSTGTATKATKGKK